MKRLENKIIIISGAAKGMGAEEARLFVSEGAKVLIGDLRDEEGTQLSNELGKNTRYVHLDVTKIENWENAVAIAEREFGHVNVLINNAGITNYGTFEEYNLDQFNHILEVNLLGCFNGIKAVLSSMKASGCGAIVNISSTAGITGYPLIPGYVSSKWGLTRIDQKYGFETWKIQHSR
jgi:3alpha(or 20beta)-hydroxysteroid dehydrogenase